MAKVEMRWWRRTTPGNTGGSRPGAGAIVVALCMSCQGPIAHGTHPPKGSPAWGASAERPPPKEVPEPFTAYDADQCNFAEAPASGAPFDQKSALEALRRASERSEHCEDGSERHEWTTGINWSSSGCVSFVQLSGDLPGSSVRECILAAYREASVPAYEGIGMHSRFERRSSAFEFERIGRLPPEVIQQVVRQHYGRFRACYEAGLGRNPTLTGRVSARFVIAEDGTVSRVGNAGSTVPDAEVVHCVLALFPRMRFPPPIAGPVTVVYPVMLEPG
jgi:hypothetical protein